MLLAIAAILMLLLLAFKLLDVPVVGARRSSELLEVMAAEVPFGQAHLRLEVKHLLNERLSFHSIAQAAASWNRTRG